MKEYKDFKLLIDGKNAFKEIINCINNAKEKIVINMFIWRDDKIGNEIAKCVLEAASRGVKVEISKDRYGLILEKAEESKKSFFHKELKAEEKVKIKALEKIYNPNNKKKVKDEYSELYNQIMNHPNIKVSKDKFKADHSKYYIIDNSLILGGINIEDKENGKDLEGREYHDYMVKLNGKRYVEDFLNKINYGIDSNENYFFGINSKKLKIFEMEKIYLDLIKTSKKELKITMAYFSYIKEFIEEIVNAYKRGVKIDIMIPGKANFQNDTNMKTVKKLLKETNNEINVYLSNKMVHTKMIINDDYITIGSTNITKKAFKQLCELNLFVKNVDSKFKDDLMNNINLNYSQSKKITNYNEIKYSKALAKIESSLV